MSSHLRWRMQLPNQGDRCCMFWNETRPILLSFSLMNDRIAGSCLRILCIKEGEKVPNRCLRWPAFDANPKEWHSHGLGWLLEPQWSLKSEILGSDLREVVRFSCEHSTSWEQYAGIKVTLPTTMMWGTRGYCGHLQLCGITQPMELMASPPMGQSELQNPKLKTKIHRSSEWVRGICPTHKFAFEF